ncbi:HAMP domain-containing sensor histidine kinase [Photobacterium sp. MCCC 1A19761]|uniref:sensor histidine kinase n=1 Tax=Photobacterium sp. MCCC 1A19761 TaxID=3115000 RepID=UPI00307F4180
MWPKDNNAGEQAIPAKLPFTLLLKGSPFASIQRNLVNSVSLVFGTILFIVFLSVDLGLDDWVEKQFEQSMLNKANYLKSQAIIKDHQVVFDFDEQFMPEYQSNEDPHFFQFWQHNRAIKRSATLDPYPDGDLIRPKLPLGTDKVVEVTLPNGELGRASLSTFVPRSEQGELIPVSLTIYESAQGLNRLLWIVDGLLIGCFLFAMALMRYITIVLIHSGLKPLEQLNQDLKSFRYLEHNEKTVDTLPEPETRVEEIEPIRRELNAFIRSNRELIQNEKRITGDIAHELKTPLAEMIALSEVYIRYPDDERISKTYQHDILTIAKRMKTIVENLLLLQRTSSLALNVDLEPLSIDDLLDQTQLDLTFKYPDITRRLHLECETHEFFLADRFSLETILSNLLDNALFYSPDASVVDIRWRRVSQQYQLDITNQLTQPISDEQLSKITRPLFQIDASRTSSERFGLGLSIIDNICRQNHYTLQFNQPQPLQLTVSIGIPRHTED